MILDEHEKMLVRELIINPRLSDNRLSRITGIPLKTINRKRKRLEHLGVLNYHISLNNGPEGTEDFTSTVMHILRFKYGIFRKQFMDSFQHIPVNIKDIQHIRYLWLGEQDGRLVVVMILESRQSVDILEIFNVEVLGKIRSAVGPDSVQETITIPITAELALLHNYAPARNMLHGKVRPDWPKDLVFVTDR